jgi:putative phage-type endonuclease
MSKRPSSHIYKSASQNHVVDTSFPFQLDVPAVAEPRPRPTVLLTPEDVLKSLEVTQEQADAIASIPQGTEAWLNARKNRITASNFGAAIGMNKYKSPRGLLKDLLWNTFRGNAATRWGSEHEDVAREAYVHYIQSQIREGQGPYTSIRVEETGLYVNPDRPWLGSSPDGVVHVSTRDGGSHKFLLEIKCPYRKRFYDPPVPDYYNCQIQGVMANMNLPYCDFVVWIPGGMQITRVNFDQDFWDHTLLPGLHAFYFDHYLLLAVAKHNGDLEEGEVEVELKL